MSTIPGLLSQIEEAIRLDYAAKIATLEEERDEKIERVRVALAEDGAPPQRVTTRARPAPVPKKSPTKKEGPSAPPPGKPGRLSDSSRELIEAILSREAEFTTSELREQFPAVSGQLLAFHLGNLVKRGEIKLIEKARGSVPSRYAPMPLNSLRNGRGHAQPSVS